METDLTNKLEWIGLRFKDGYIPLLERLSFNSHGEEYEDEIYYKISCLLLH